MCTHHIVFVAAVAQDINWCFDMEVPNEETFEGLDLKSLDIDQVRDYHVSTSFLHIIFSFSVVSTKSKPIEKGDNIQKKSRVLVSKYPLNSQKWPSMMVPMASTYQFQGRNVFLQLTNLSVIYHIVCKPIIANYCICNIMEKWLLFHHGFCLCYPGFMFKTGTCHVQGPS